MPYNEFMEAELAQQCIDIIRSNSRPMKALETGKNFLSSIDRPVRACIFDVYGTLFISGSGDIGTVQNSARPNHFYDSFRAAGFSVSKPGLGEYAEQLLLKAVKQQHDKLRGRGVDYPEVDILQIWSELCRSAAEKGYISANYNEKTVYRLTVEYETRVNPVWPMGGLAHLFSRLREDGIVTGIVSNAQFYTPLLFPALVRESTDELGLPGELCIYSYRLGRAKPSASLFSPLISRLEEQYGIQPQETLYIGNDMLNDIYTAGESGCLTCLFAGDRRSLRLRQDNPCCKKLVPDAIVVSLDQVFSLL